MLEIIFFPNIVYREYKYFINDITVYKSQIKFNLRDIKILYFKI